MPTPKPGEETREEWMDRCIPAVLEDGAATSTDQAVAMCSQMWEDAGGKSYGQPLNLKYGQGKDRPKMLGRAYSFITIKAVDEDQRTIEGLATTPTPDRLDDIVDPMGAKFSLPIPFLWQHKHAEPIGHVIKAKKQKDGIPFTAKIAKADEPGRLKDRLDEAWQSIKLGLVSAVSIGFNPIKWSWMDNGGIEFQEWDWLELSAVTIPAQPEAVITAVKQFDRLFREQQGIQEFVPPTPAQVVEEAVTKEIQQDPAPAAIGRSARVVRLSDPPASRQLHVIREIRK